MLAVGKRNWPLWTIGIVVLALAMILVVPPAGARSLRDFDPARTADLELRMWKAYYAKENARLFGWLVVLLREQYHYSWGSAIVQAAHLARARSDVWQRALGLRAIAARPDRCLRRSATAIRRALRSSRRRARGTGVVGGTPNSRGEFATTGR